MLPRSKVLKLGALGLCFVVILGGGFGFWFVYEPEIPKIVRPLRSSFSTEEIKNGEQLATVGDCIVCHTSDYGRPFAGSRPLPTPFGTLYSTNITPDEDTGIGNWSEEAFRRAVKEGVSRDGSHLYPALPYEHFINVEDRDVDSIYAFLMTREPVSQVAPQNQLLPGLGIRQSLAGWKLLFLHKRQMSEDASRSAAWNRGRYLVDGLGHCGACHTPRNMLGGEKWDEEFAGGIAEGWNAPPLDGSNPSADRWNLATLTEYLKSGTSAVHSTAAGPMGPVVEGLSRLNDQDVNAIATYIDAVMHPNGDRKAQSQVTGISPNYAVSHESLASDLFNAACAGCHDPKSPMDLRGRPPLSMTTDLNSDDPRNAIQAVLQGIKAPVGSNSPYMPAFTDTLSDKQIADLLAYTRSRFTPNTPWPDLEESVRDLRKENLE